jgi:hypothetical protein
LWQFGQLKLTGVPKRSHSDPEFTRHVCSRIDNYIIENQITDVEAARVLGVRKQMIRPYRLGKALPGTQAIARACVHWNLTFNYQGFEISANTFASPNGKPSVVPTQLRLPFGEPLEFRGVSHGIEEIEMVVTLNRVS